MVRWYAALDLFLKRLTFFLVKVYNHVTHVTHATHVFLVLDGRCDTEKSLHRGNLPILDEIGIF